MFESLLASKINRRQWLKTSGGIIAGLALPTFGGRKALAAPGEPHFFLHLYISQGVDSSSLFDARPLSFTQAEKIHNYFGVEPAEWTGSNGFKTLARSPVDILKPFKDDFSIINGVIMNTAFDGHDQNALSMMTGNPFGGDWFVPKMAKNQSPLDYLQFGRFSSSGSLNNASLGLAASGTAVKSLVTALSLRNSGSSVEDAMIKRNLVAVSQYGDGVGFTAKGARKILNGLEGSKSLIELIKKVVIPPAPENPEGKTTFNDVQIMMEFMKHGLTKHFFYAPDVSFSVDSHDEESSKKVPENYPQITKIIAEVFRALKTTEYSAGKSFLDVTTVVVSSEFSRTMRQFGKPIDNTGTDHNPLGNSVLVGGKGIRKGAVFGATDLDVLAGKEFGEVSLCHKQLDGDLLKAMGKPIDFATGLPLVGANLPEYDPAKFLTFSNIANTLMDLFEVDPAARWEMGRNLPKAQSLAFLRT